MSHLRREASDFPAPRGWSCSLGLGYDLPIGGKTALTPFANYFFGTFSGGGANTMQVGLGINAY